MKPCIYCLEKKPDDAFNREHVIPEAFGTFEGNLVLECVFRACNSYFGDTIDLKLARDSIEGIDRFWSGMKSAAEFKSLGPRSTTTVRFKEGAIHGGEGYAVANPNGTELRVFAFPSLGFEQAPAPTKWFRVADVPEKDDLPKHGIDLSREFLIHVRQMSGDDAAAVLRAKGFNKIEPFGEMPHPPEETIETLMVGIIGRPEKRAATKIALNYLAKVHSASLVRTDAFNDVRNFARYDIGDGRVHTSENPLGVAQNGSPVRGHYLAVQTMPSGLIVAQVSLYMRIRYVVHLMTHCLSTATPMVSSAHFFNIDTRIAKPVPVPPLVAGKQLTPVD